jgi:hypothetical protein
LSETPETAPTTVTPSLFFEALLSLLQAITAVAITTAMDAMMIEILFMQKLVGFIN